MLRNIEEYQHWRYDTYQFNTPEEEIDITFNGVTYKGIYDSESKPTLYIEYGIEALNNYHIYYNDNRVGNVDINDRSGNIQKIRFAVDFEAVYYVSMGIAIIPHNREIPVKYDSLMYIIKTNQ